MERIELFSPPVDTASRAEYAEDLLQRCDAAIERGTPVERRAIRDLLMQERSSELVALQRQCAQQLRSIRHRLNVIVGFLWLLLTYYVAVPLILLLLRLPPLLDVLAAVGVSGGGVDGDAEAGVVASVLNAPAVLAVMGAVDSLLSGMAIGTAALAVVVYVALVVNTFAEHRDRLQWFLIQKWPTSLIWNPLAHTQSFVMQRDRVIQYYGVRLERLREVLEQDGGDGGEGEASGGTNEASHTRRCAIQ